MTDLFQTDPKEDTLEIPAFEDLVGEGKRYADTTAVAKAVTEKDRYIARLLEEKREIEAALNKRSNEEEFLTKLEEITKRKAAEVEANTQSQGVETTAVDTKKIEEIVAAQVAAKEAERRREANLAAVAQKLLDTYGPDYKSRVQAQAKALGVGTEFLSSVAADNPAAFYRLVGVDAPAQRVESPAPPRSQATFIPNSASGAKNYEYWKRYRETEGESKYFSKAVQKQIWDSLKSMGEEEFYKNR